MVSSAPDPDLKLAGNDDIPEKDRTGTDEVMAADPTERKGCKIIRPP